MGFDYKNNRIIKDPRRNTKNKKAQIIQERLSSSILFGMGSYIVVDEALEINR
ncbi:hypothetical protein KO488_13820 [Poseidonibacter lekithochrous]|uniref:hypothetical protein n=1 Tax=Poseidonibacter TaxID=2321187 RepID=UPI001C09AA01|nr:MULTISPECIES: hypothetical protein [Poseidonibacter]MBU3015840.1 hypothetical protein [Poseidonibacter lekithochrous]MDO6829139.1 hypothetical protein [Poseidonibacter sp. 1_MG-2023]